MKIRRYTLHTEEECRIVAKRIIELQQENQQLKEDKNQLEAKLGEANDIIDIEMELRDFWITKYHEVRQVLDETREYIKEKERDGTLWTVKATDDLLQILDKVKE